MRRSSINPLEVLYKDFVDISYENASFLILEDCIVLGIVAKLISNWEQKMLHIKRQHFSVKKHILQVGTSYLQMRNANNSDGGGSNGTEP